MRARSKTALTSAPLPTTPSGHRPPCLFEQATYQFLDSISPTVSNLISHMNQTHTSLTQACMRTNNIHLSLDLARVEQVAQQGVRSLLSNLLALEKFGQLEKVKPNNTIRIMFENFSSLPLFVQGKEKGRKFCQINKLMKEYNVDVMAMAGCKMRVDWRFTKPTTNVFDSYLLKVNKGVEFVHTISMSASTGTSEEGHVLHQFVRYQQ
jgi:hypothetical protein